eukprot:m.22736 g.22736  ORF g.22736 m.22736 type:complete len:625 (-) comp7431_c0_seq2:77-1951(-)
MNNYHEGQQPALENNWVAYSIFCNDASKVILNSLLAKFREFLAPLLCGYIWHRDPFTLSVAPASAPSENSDGIPIHLHGKTEFGDNINDEWFIVYLLRELTTAFTDIWVSVVDNDDQFLLIEAADALPRWLTADVAKNRVFLHQGHLHIIPIPQNPRELGIFPPSYVSLQQAQNLLLNHGQLTKASADIQSLISKRLNVFPEDAKKAIHYAKCYIPKRAAAALEVEPQLISAVVAALCERDPVDMKAASKMLQFQPKTRIMHRVKMSRSLYAQLYQEKFQGGKLFGQRPPPASPEFKYHDLGTKLSVGLEILITYGDHMEDTNTPSAQGPEWNKFLESLRQKNYFKENIEGSAEYKSLMKEAERYFLDFASGLQSTPVENVSFLKKWGVRLNQVLQSSQHEAVALPFKQVQDDDDTWMDMMMSDLDGLIQARYGNLLQEGHNAQAAEALQGLVSSLGNFVTTESTHEGAEFDKTGVDELDALDGSDTDSEEDMDDGAVNFDMGNFMNLIQAFQAEVENQNDKEDIKENVKKVESDEQKAHNEEPSVEDYGTMMDEELRDSVLPKSFAAPDENEKEAEEVQPVDMDFNLVKNALQSFSSQNGAAGPISNILGSLGLDIPANEDES